jgi:hypothetical protein
MDQPIVEILSRLGCLNLARKHIRLDINSFSIGREMLDAKVTCSSSRALRVQSITSILRVDPIRRIRGYETSRSQGGRLYKCCCGKFEKASLLACSLSNTLIRLTTLTHLELLETTSRQRRKEKMCRFFAHTYHCGHTNIVLSKHCPRAALIQQACRDGDICANVQLDEKCSSCHQPVKILVQARLVDDNTRR